MQKNQHTSSPTWKSEALAAIASLPAEGFSNEQLWQKIEHTGIGHHSVRAITHNWAEEGVLIHVQRGVYRRGPKFKLELAEISQPTPFEAVWRAFRDGMNVPKPGEILSPLERA